MTRTELTNVIAATPEVGAVEVAEKNALIASFIDILVPKIAMVHDWDFVMRVADETTVADQSDYTLRGVKDDCRNIYNIRIGTGTPDDGYDLMDKRGLANIDESLSGRDASGVGIWVPNGRKSGFPRVRIIDTPADATKTLRYRYWRKDVTFEEFPGEDFALAYLLGVKFLFFPVFEGAFRAELTDIINRYQPSGGEDDPALLDPLVRALNNRRAGKFKYGG